MDVKTAFLNDDLDEEWHQKFDEVVLSNGYLLNQADKYVYSKFDETGKGVIICLYVDDMLIFDTDQVHVDLTKEFLSSRFSMKDMREADVILGIKIKHESNGIAISQSRYIEKVLKKFNYFDCIPVSTPMDKSEKLMPNNGQAVSQLEYSRVVGFLMYAMTCTRSDIAFVVGKLSRLTYTGYPSVLEGYTDASWISNTEDNSSTSGWVFLLGGGVISWASKKQTCITGSTIESEFVALAAAGKEAKWLKNLFHKIPLWSKPVAPMSIRCDSAATLANACSQMYNGKSRHLGVRHSMIRKLITNGVIYIEFVRSQQNLADHLTKGLTKDLVIKSAEGMGLKFTILTTNTPYPSRKIRRIRACTHQRPQRNEDQYAVSREDQYAVLEIWNEYNILEDIKRGPYSKKLQYAVSNPLDTPCVGVIGGGPGGHSEPRGSAGEYSGASGAEDGAGLEDFFFVNWDIAQVLLYLSFVWSNGRAYMIRKHFKTLSLGELRSPDFNLFSNQENSEEEVAKTMAETMEQYMSKTRADYGSGVVRPKIKDKDNFELKGQFLKELRTNTFIGSDYEDANEHIEKVLEIVDLFHTPNITIDQVMLRAFPMSLTGAASRWLRNKPTGLITTWEDLKTKFLSKYCLRARTAKKMEEINNFQQESDENLYQAWERFKELLMKCPQHYLTKMQEGVLFYNGLDVPTRQILDSRGAIPYKNVAYAKTAIQEMAEYSQKWHNGTSSVRSTETSDGLAAIQA
ncbi:zinc finger, CCHC-type containing protein [Tanacetum coccineum]